MSDMNVFGMVPHFTDRYLNYNTTEKEIRELRVLYDRVSSMTCDKDDHKKNLRALINIIQRLAVESTYTN